MSSLDRSLTVLAKQEADGLVGCEGIIDPKILQLPDRDSQSSTPFWHQLSDNLLDAGMPIPQQSARSTSAPIHSSSLTLRKPAPSYRLHIRASLKNKRPEYCLS